MRHSNRRQRVCHIPRQTPNPAVNTDAHRRGFARAEVAGYLTRLGITIRASPYHEVVFDFLRTG